jgi:hypothetical protein
MWRFRRRWSCQRAALCWKRPASCRSTRSSSRMTERRSGSMPLRQLLDCKLIRCEGLRPGNTTSKSACWARSAGFRQCRLADLQRWLQPGHLAHRHQARLRHRDQRAASGAGRAGDAVTALLIKLDSKGPVFYRKSARAQWTMPFMVPSSAACAPMPRQDGQPRWATRQ